MRKPYPSYKDSGVNWIGEIPSTWNSGKMKYKLLKNDGGTWGRDSKINEDGIIVIRSTEIEIDGNWNLSNPMKRSLNEDEINKCLLYEGDIVITKSSGSSNHIGKSVVVSKEIEKLACCFSNFVQRIRFRNFYPRLYHYILNSYVVREQYRYLTQTTTGLGNLNSSTLDEVQIPLIPLSEQKQILKYLDYKTQLIDQLIDKTKKKIELLKEKRTALINHCVTKGLNPDVEMKNSGVEWIGGIPKHWEVKKLKYLGEVYSSTIDRYIYDDEIQVSVCHYPDAYNNEFINKNVSLNKGSCSSAEFERFQLKKGLVILTKDSESPDDIGIPCYIEKNLKNSVCGYHLSIIEANNNQINSKFLFRFIQSDIIRCHFEIYSKGITRYSLGKSIIKNLFVNLPPVPEQQQIIEYIDSQTKKIDTAIEKENKRIEILKEYRKSLISEVVTGKIDVRDEVVA